MSVYCWLYWRKLKGLPKLKRIDNFRVVDQSSMTEYDDFRQQHTTGLSLYDRSTIVVPDMPVLRAYFQSLTSGADNYKEGEWNGMPIMLINETLVDDITKWMRGHDLDYIL